MELEKNNFINLKTGKPFKTRICTRTLYNYIDQRLFPNLTNKGLPREGKQQKRKQRKVRYSHKNINGKCIWKRPEEANECIEEGHWEMDCIEGAKGKGESRLLTMVDRKTRETLIFKLSNQTQRCVINLLNKLEGKLGRVKFSKRFKTITVDNGSEFLNHKSMEKSLFSKTKKRTLIYYPTPIALGKEGLMSRQMV